ncbi:MAG TPA: hypothetical protein VFG72_15055 [Marmoricola sp.]|nr:hypothetical protein [Marmoricola sp.]
MSVAVSQPARQPVGRSRPAPTRESLGDTIALARARSLENRRCGRRVRQEARDALGVVLFSAAASTTLAVVLTLVLAHAG